jgi:hypothetical protein
VLVEHRRAGQVPARRDRRRHLVMLGGGPAWPRATHPTIRCRLGVARCASPTWRLARIKQRRPKRANVA